MSALQAEVQDPELHPAAEKAEGVSRFWQNSVLEEEVNVQFTSFGPTTALSQPCHSSL